MRVLLISDLADTGFGRVGRELGWGLLGRGHDIRAIGINWRGYGGEVEAACRTAGPGEEHAAASRIMERMDADPLVPLTLPADMYGDAMGHNLTAPAVQGRLWPGWSPEAILLVADPQAALNRIATDQGACASVRTLNYVPVEGSGLPPAWGPIWRCIVPVAMCAFGRDELQTLLGRPVPLAYHGVSPAFRPLSPEDPGDWKGERVTSREEAKAALKLDGTVILRTDRHIVRKAYPALLRIMDPILTERPDVQLVIHCSLRDVDGDLNVLISRMTGAQDRGPLNWTHGQVKLTRAHDTFRGLTDEELRVLYAAADLFVSPTMAEGFGLCLAESIACGTPVVSTAYSSIPEVVGPGGVCVPPAGHWTNVYGYEWAIPDEPAMRREVRRLIADPDERARLAEAGRAHVAQFTWASAVDVFDRLLREGAAAQAA